MSRRAELPSRRDPSPKDVEYPVRTARLARAAVRSYSICDTRASPVMVSDARPVGIPGAPDMAHPFILSVLSNLLSILRI
ncbi:hypothetical protein GCM10010488_25880 [Oerskovia jenensis]